jgi:maleamate amidohydrolase
VADKHESPHFANLYDLAVKYADVVPTAEVESWLISLKTNQPEPA